MSGPTVSGLGRWWHRLTPLIGLVLFVAAVAVLGRELRHMPPARLAQALRQFPPGALALATIFTFLNYLILTGYDQLAFLYIRRPIARWQIAMASFVGYAIANNVGFALLSGTSARYRFYSRWGLSGQEISRVVLFYSGTFWLGLLVLGGWTLALRAGHGPRAVRSTVGRARRRMAAAGDGPRLPGAHAAAAVPGDGGRHRDCPAAHRPGDWASSSCRPSTGAWPPRCCTCSSAPRGRTSCCSSESSLPRSSSPSSATCRAASGCSSP